MKYIFKYCMAAVILSMMNSSSANQLENLTEVSWAHAVNSADELTIALNSRVNMIEADIVLGTVQGGNGDVEPIMGHPPKKTSDLSLETFMTIILRHNLEATDNIKGVKLDFKSIEAFNGALPMLKNLWNSMNYPIWINADILPGPKKANTKPVDADDFLKGCRQLPNATLSIGWTTYWNFIPSWAKYSADHINEMVNVLDRAELQGTLHAITYPVRAGLAANSLDTLTDLLLRTKTDATLTIWSSIGDYVNVKSLRKLILTVGVERVYVDVPKNLRKKLNLHLPYSETEEEVFADT